MYTDVIITGIILLSFRLNNQLVYIMSEFITLPVIKRDVRSSLGTQRQYTNVKHVKRNLFSKILYF